MGDLKEVVYIKWKPREKLPRKKKKQYIKHMGPIAYKLYLKGATIITSDYPNVNGITLAPWNKKVWRKIQNKFSRWTPKITIDSRYCTVSPIKQYKDE